MSAALPQGWQFIRNADGCIGIKAPPPKDGESRRTSACIYASTDRDLHELLSKFVDHLAAAEAPTVAQPVAWTMQSMLDSAEVSRGRGGPFDRHVWSEGPTNSFPVPLYAAAAPQPVQEPVYWQWRRKDQPWRLEAPTVAQPVQEPVHVEAVATVQAGEDGLYLDWLIEGGICALVEGCTLVMPSRPITDDFGAGEVYTAPPQPVPLTDEQQRDLVKECGLDWHRGYMPLFDGDPTNRFSVLIEAIERAHGIGDKA